MAPTLTTQLSNTPPPPRQPSSKQSSIAGAEGLHLEDHFAATDRQQLGTNPLTNQPTKSLNIGYGGEPTVPQTRNQQKSWIVKYC